MLETDDFHIDNVLLRQVKQAARQAARDLEDDDDDDDPAPRGTQNRPEDVDEEGDSVDVEEEQRQTIARVKKERQQSRGPRVARGQATSSAPDSDEIEAMDTE
jgi:hypothetical protein